MAFTNILSLLGDIGSWLLLPLNFIFLTIDGIVYSLVAYSYKLFMLMAKLNFNSMLTWFSPIISRVNTLIAVLVMFVIAYNLIQYLINPDKASDRNSGGVAIIKNIAIAALLLIVYNFAFSLINEFTFILVGAPDGYKYSALFDTFGVENTDGDPGLIQRLILGSGSNSEEINDFGNTLAVGTLNIFLHGNEENVNLEEVTDSSYIGRIYSNALSNKNSFNMMFVTAAAPEVGRSVEYKWPIISTAVGAYLVYTIVTISIAIGVRAFKLVALQVLAPIAIVTIIKDGTGGKVWKAYLSVLGKTYIDVFIRVAAMLFTTAFISVAWRNIGTLYTTDENAVTKFLLLILVIVAGFKFAKDLPAFIDSVFGSKLAENNKNGIGNFLGAAGGALLGAAGGAIAGGLSGAKNAGPGFKNKLKGAFSGGTAGMGSGFTKGIKTGFNAPGQKFGEVLKSTKAGFQDVATVGAVGVGGYFRGVMDGKHQKQDDRKLKALNDFEQARNDALAKRGPVTGSFQAAGYTVSFNNLDLTKSKSDARSAILNHNSDYIRIRDEYQAALNRGDAATAASHRITMQAFETAFNTYYDSEYANTISTDSECQRTSEVAAALNVGDARANNPGLTAGQYQSQLLGSNSEKVVNTAKTNINVSTNQRNRRKISNNNNNNGGNR